MVVQVFLFSLCQWVTVRTPWDEWSQLGGLWGGSSGKPQLYVSHQCSCASVSLRCPRVSSSYLPTKRRPPLLNPTSALDSPNLNLFGFQPLPPGSMASAFKLSHWWGFWSSNREHLQPHRDHSPGMVTLSALPGNLCYLHHILQSPWRLHCCSSGRKMELFK